MNENERRQTFLREYEQLCMRYGFQMEPRGRFSPYAQTSVKFGVVDFSAQFSMELVPAPITDWQAPESAPHVAEIEDDDP
jgi:hypothetical protein